MTGNHQDLEENTPLLSRAIACHKGNKAEDCRREIVLPTKEGYLFFKVEELALFQSEDIYSYLYDVYGKKYFISKSLKWLEEKLSDASFQRIPKSYLINTYHIALYLKDDGGCFVMEGGGKVPISRSKRVGFLDQLIRRK